MISLSLLCVIFLFSRSDLLGLSGKLYSLEEKANNNDFSPVDDQHIIHMIENISDNIFTSNKKT